MKILITGASGFVGRHLVRALEEENHEIVTFNSANFTQMWYCQKDTFDVIVHLAVIIASTQICWLIGLNINKEQHL